MNEYFEFKGQKYTKGDIFSALNDIDKEKYEFTCQEEKQYVLVYNEKHYPVKKVCECLARNRNKIITNKDFKCTKNLRERFVKLGFNIVDKNITSEMEESMQNDVNYYWVNQSQNYEDEKNGNYICAPNTTGQERQILKELKVGDKIVSYNKKRGIQATLDVTNAYYIDDKNNIIVNVNYTEIKPINKTALLKNITDHNIDIHYKYSPFDKNNDINQGYCFKINKNLYNAILDKPVPTEVTQSEKKEEDMIDNYPKNLILYGPPGTGKTYNTIVEAIKILDKPLYEQYINTKPTLDEYKEWFAKNPPSGKGEISDNYLNGAFSNLQKYEDELNNQKYSLFNITTEKELDDYLNEIKNSNIWKKYEKHNWIETIVNNYLDFYKYWNKSYSDLQTRFKELKDEGRIEFVTFHQSYSYEEFVEGIKPDIDWDDEIESQETSSNEIKYVGKKGVFKNICEEAKEKLYEISDLNITFDDVIKKLKEELKESPFIKNITRGEIEIKDIKGNDVYYLYGSTKTQKKILLDKIALLLEQNKNYDNADLFFRDYNHEAYSVRFYPFAFYKNLQKIKKELEQEKTITLNRKTSINKNAEKYVLIIDEINRGNISKIFGELITLIEEDKRLGEEHELKITLPYSQQKDFGVPSNLYIIGTMNTSDRSIASVDIALRRRFKFKEIMPEQKLVKDLAIPLSIKVKDKDDNEIKTNLKVIFKVLNKRISALLDRDHQIGHSYFIKVGNIDELKQVWFDSVMPLLNEYFYGDWEKLQAILGKAGDKNNDYSFIEQIDTKNLFATDDCEVDECYDFRDKSGYLDDTTNKKFLKALSHAFSDTLNKKQNKEDVAEIETEEENAEEEK